MTESPPESRAPLSASPEDPSPAAAGQLLPLRAVWDRIKQHKVVQWTLAYLALAYTLLHGAEMLGNSLDWPHNLLRLFTLILILGVPVAITLAWYHGARGQQRMSGSELMIIAILVAIGGTYLWRDSGTEHVGESAAIAASAPKSAAPAISEKSVAVLPFVDMSEKKDQEYFSEGLSEELINLLSKVPGLHVPARTSSFYFKDRSEDIPTIARRLMVAHVLEGSVRKSGNNLRITVQLIRADNGYHLWSETYDRKLDDIFKLQDDVAGAVVKALKLSLLDGQSPHVAPVANSEAYTLYLRARFTWTHGGQPADDQRAINLLELAVKKDPRFARAWAALAVVRIDSYTYYLVGSFQEIRAQAYVEAQKALELDPGLSDAHLALGTVFQLDWDWKAAEVEYRRASELDPGNAIAFVALSALASSQGRHDEAIRYAQMATQLDPVSMGAFVALGNAYLMAGKPRDAEATYRQTIELSPADAGLHLMTGWSLLAGGQPAAALNEIERETDGGWRAAGSALALEILGRRSESEHALQAALELTPERSEYEIAQVYASRSDADSAILWLERAYLRRSADISLYVRGDPVFKNLRTDSRYKALLHKMNLPE